MTFEEWKLRPVYVAQCRTWAKAAEMGIFSHKFRCLPAYRDQPAREGRRRVAIAIRAERNVARQN